MKFSARSAEWQYSAKLALALKRHVLNKIAAIPLAILRPVTLFAALKKSEPL
jgi:hypothetical protein